MQNCIHSRVKNNPRIKPGFTFLLVLVLFLIIYSLFFSGIFSTDDEHILAAQSLSLAFDHEMNFSRVIGNERVFSYSQFIDPYASQALNIEPAQALLGSILVEVASFFQFGRVQALFLLNIWVTAITASIIFLTVVSTGYSQKTGLIASALFGLGTIALPYSHTYFRDPLAMMFLACAWYCMQTLAQGNPVPYLRWRRVFLWVGLMLSLIAGILAKNTIVVAVPVIFLAMILNRKKTNSVKGRQHPNWFMVAGVILLGIASWFLIAPKFPILARFTPAYYSDLLKFFVSTPRPHFFEAISGPFISPGKSLFVFSPVLIFAVWGLIFRFKYSWPAWLFLISLVIAQALFYDFEWAGHNNFGTRYLLPAIPPLVLVIVPLIDRILKNRPGRVLFVFVAMVSFFIQILGVLVPVGEYYTMMFSSAEPVSEWSTIWSWRYSIFVFDAKWLLDGNGWNLALARMPENILLILLCIAGILALLVVCFLVQKIRRYAWVLVVLCMGLNGLMLASYRNDAIYFTYREDFRLSMQYLSQQEQTGDAVLIRSYGTPIWNYWMNWAPPGIHWISLPYYFPMPSLIEKYRQTKNPADALNTNSQILLEESLAASDGKAWLLLPSDAPGANLGLEKAWMDAHTTSLNCSTFEDGNDQTEVCEYALLAP